MCKTKSEMKISDDEKIFFVVYVIEWIFFCNICNSEQTFCLKHDADKKNSL